MLEDAYLGAKLSITELVKPAASAAKPAAPAAAVGLDDNVASLLTYLIPFVGPILFLTMAPYNQKKNIRFHAFQALFLDVAYVGLWIAWEIVASLIGSVWNFTLWRIWGLVWTLIWVSFLAVAVYCMIKAYQGEQKELPVIGPLARQKA